MSEGARIQTDVSLSVRGDDLDPHDVAVSLSLRLQGEWFHKRGDPFTRDGEEYKRLDGFCVFCSRAGVSPDAPFDAHAEWMVERLEPHLGVLSSWVERGWSLRLTLLTIANVRSAGPRVGPGLLLRIAKLGLPTRWNVMYAPGHSGFQTAP